MQRHEVGVGDGGLEALDHLDSLRRLADVRVERHDLDAECARTLRDLDADATHPQQRQPPAAQPMDAGGRDLPLAGATRARPVHGSRRRQQQREGVVGDLVEAVVGT